MALKKITDAEMDAAGVVAAPDVLSGTPAQNKAVFDRMVRQLVAPAYNAAVDAINEIDGVEKGIETAEAQRVAAENARAAAETARENAEAARQTAETERQNAEAARQSAETAREDKETGYVADAEAWARGTRNGVAVGASDPAYENNAAYYRDQARSVVGGEYVSFGQAQPLTAAQKKQARANIGAPAPYTAGDGISISGSVISAKVQPCNRNLLDNWYFGNPVNQRGKTVYSGAGYGIDRWKAEAVTPNVTTIKDGYIELSQNALISEILEEPYSLCGKQVTVSALTTTGLCSATATVPSKEELSAITTDETIGVSYFAVNGNSTGYVCLQHSKEHTTKVMLRAYSGYTVGVIAVKLELGSQQTLAHQENGVWVLNEIPDYGEELTRCMRYLQIISTPYDTSGNGVAIGYANNTVDLWVPIPLAVPMRISPTPTIPTGGVSLFKVGKTSNALKDVTKVTGGWAMQTGGACSARSLIFTASGLTAGDTYALFLKNGAQIVFSAEL